MKMTRVCILDAKKRLRDPYLARFTDCDWLTRDDRSMVGQDRRVPHEWLLEGCQVELVPGWTSDADTISASPHSQLGNKK